MFAFYFRCFSAGAISSSSIWEYQFDSTLGGIAGLDHFVPLGLTKNYTRDQALKGFDSPKGVPTVDYVDVVDNR
jgi:hypothetical protein